MSKSRYTIGKFARVATAFVTAIILSIGLTSTTNISPAFAADTPPASDTWVPQITVFLADGVTPYNGQPLAQNDKVIVKGTGFDPSSNIGGRGVPIPNTLSQGVYIAFGSFLDNWKPSNSAPSSARKTADMKWALSEEVLNQVPAPFQSQIRADWTELKPDGTFTSELEITGLEDGLTEGNWGIYTYAAGGIKNASQELTVPLNIGQGQDTVIETPKPTVSVSPTTIDPKIENTLIVSGSGFEGPGAASGVYVLFGLSDLWQGQGPLPPTGWNSLNWVRPDQIHEGVFSTTVVVPADTLDIAKSYQVATSAAHGLSATDRSLDSLTPISLVEVLSGAPITAPTKSPAKPTSKSIQSQEANQEEQCTAQSIENATLSWGLKQSFRAYVLSSVAKGKITTNGVKDINSKFEFSGGHGSYNVKDSIGEISLPGSIHFEGHDNILQVTISDIQIRVLSSTSGTIYVDYIATDLSNKKTSRNNVAFASISFTSSVQNNVLILTGTKTTLLSGGVDSFAGVYKAGESMDLINLRAPLGTTMVCGAFTSRSLPTTGTQSQTIVVVSLWLILCGSCLIISQRRRKNNYHNHQILKRVPSIIAICLTGVLVTSCTTGTAKANNENTSPKKKSSNSSINPRSITGPSTAQTVADVEPITPTPKVKMPVTFTDERGKELTISDVDRIIAVDIYGTLAQTVVGLGLGDRLVGRGQTSTGESLKDLPVVTQNGIVLNAEAILSLEPTIVLVDSSLGPPSVPDQIEASGITVVHLSEKRSLATISTRIQAVANVLGISGAGKKLATRVADELKEADQKISELAPSPKMRIAFLYLRGTGGYYFIFGPGEGSDDLIKALKGIDVAGKIGIKGASPAKAESLIEMDPEVILTMTDGFSSAGGIDGLLKRPGVAQTTAGSNKRIVDMNDGQILAFGPNIADVLVSLATAIYNPSAK